MCFVTRTIVENAVFAIFVSSVKYIHALFSERD